MNREELFYHKLVTDRAWYIENFLFIRNKKSQLVPFVLNDAQKVVIKEIEKAESEGKLLRFIVLKARQMGLSTLFEGIIFHDTVNNKYKNSLIIAHEEPASVNLFNMSKLYYENLPDVIRPMKKYSNGKILSFENPTGDDKDKKNNPGLMSKITIATAGSGEVGRSATVHNVHVSELAFFPDAKTTMLGLMQSVPDENNTFVVLESTANGIGDYFHQMWGKATKGENNFIPIFLPWFIDPGYSKPFYTDAERQIFIDEVNFIFKDSSGRDVRTYEYELMNKFNLTYEQMNWRKNTIKDKCQGDEELFMQEYPSTPEEAFIASGRPKFNISSLKKYQTKTKEPIRRGYLTTGLDGATVFLEDKRGYISIYEEPKQKKNYCIGADVAEGLVDGDYSCGVVGSYDDNSIVAMWHGHIDPDLYGRELVKLAKYYNDAYIGVENNNHGLATLKSIQNTEYWNIYYSKSYDQMTEKMSKKLGWTTNTKTKPLMIDKLAEYVREMYLKIPSELLISEMFTYVIDDRGSTNAQSGCYDDTVMATAIMLQLMLEHRGDDYVPDVSSDNDQVKKRRPDIIDELFESDNTNEYSI